MIPLINAKTNTILTMEIFVDVFPKILQKYFPARSNIHGFSAKKESVIVLKMKNICRKNLAIFHNIKKERFIFLITYLFLTFVKMECFLKIYRYR